MEEISVRNSVRKSQNINDFNIVYGQLDMYDSACQIYCNWSSLKPGVKFQHMP